MSGFMDHTDTSRPGRIRPVWIVTLIAGAVLLVVIAVIGASMILRDTPSSGLAPASSSPSNPGTTATPSPSISPEPTPAEFDLSALEVPTIESVYPDLPRTTAATLEDLPGKAAAPRDDRTPVWSEPDISRQPTLALAATQYDYDARWLVLDEREEWIQVLLPYGRGALPSQDEAAVNGTAGWVRADSVELEREDRSIVIDLSDRAMTVDDGRETSTVPAGIGAPDTPTPRGISQVMTLTMASNTGLSLFLSAQSESLDTFAGVDYAATALHVGEGQGQEISNGCVRLTPDGLDAVKDLPAGVPVLVQE